MKKVVIGIILAAVLATVPVTQTFADSPVHPGGLGIGALWGGSLNNGLHSNVALSLKLPTVPIFWGIRLGGFDSTLWVGLQGDYYILGSELIPTLSWFLGIGGYVNVWLGNDLALGFGARLPIGLTWQPINIFELFLNLAPQIGGYIWTHGDGGFDFPHGGFFGFEIGLRLWL